MRGNPQRYADQAERGHLYEILLIVFVAVVGYAGWKFVPPLKDRFVIEQATKQYVERIGRQSRVQEIQSDLYDQLDSEGIDLDAVEIEVDYEANKPPGRITAPVLRSVDVTVHYSPVIRHPGGAVTELEFTLTKRKAWNDDW